MVQSNPLFSIRLFVGFFTVAIITVPAIADGKLHGSQPLTMEGEIDRQMIAGVSTFLDRELADSVESRNAIWKTTHAESLAENRQRLKHMLGIRDRRPESPEMELVATTTQGARVGIGNRSSSQEYSVFAVRWRAFGNVFGEGLLLKPAKPPLAYVIAIPDADQTPEQLAGLTKGIDPSSQYARILVEQGCQVLVPVLINRNRSQFEWSGRRVDVTNREFLYRSAFILGRHLIGYEVQKVLAGVDWFRDQDPNGQLAIVGWGEGGLLSLFASAVDQRINLTCVSGYFEPRENVWRQPVDRNIFGQLTRLGDAELAAMIGSRTLIVEASGSPTLSLSGGKGAPGQLRTPGLSSVRHEFERAHKLAAAQNATIPWSLIESGEDGNGKCYCKETRAAITRALALPQVAATASQPPQHLRDNFDPEPRMHRQMIQIDQHTQQRLRESADVRKQYLSGLKSDSLEAHERALPAYRKRFSEDVIGRFDRELLPMNARTRQSYKSDKWTGYEVVLDVFPDVIAYGILLLPNDMKPNERRPVVVCQHGLEGRPQDTIGTEKYSSYKAFAGQLADRGFITFAPQNLYRHRDDFRVLQRKANPLGKTLFSIITPQHQQIIHWLKTQPFVDGDRIAFYGLSYGGKTAMRVPALLTDYCLSICSGDFNEWVDKTASTRNQRGYVWTDEYEIYEFDLGSTFNYAEMAALIAPRPFMVERGHRDGVADDETVAYEFAKVRRRYAKLGIADACEIEWFSGPHTINGKGTFDFLHKHLQWPKRPTK